jgi:hypothetical protein
MSIKFLNRSIWQRLFGIPATKEPESENSWTYHSGELRLDYVKGTNTVQCCSINKSTYTFAGKKIHGPNPKPVDTYPIKKDGDNLYIKLS